MFREFELDFTSGMNILVGKNDSGKSTLIEAINLALTGRIHGRLFSQELSPYFINLAATSEYARQLASGQIAAPPTIIIDLFLESSDQTEILRGTNNIFGENACGVRIQAKLSQDFAEEYQSFIAEPAAVRLVPTEYFRVDWLAFSGNAVTARNMPATASVIDPASLRLQSGVDFHLQEIIRTQLEPKQRVELSRQYRSLREEFGKKDSVKAINDRLGSEQDGLTDRKLSLAIDISQRYTWESGLAAHLDDLPFQLTGRGDQNSIKTLLAIGRATDEAHVVLIEEPETHLSYTSLRRLISRIEERCAGKQLIIATHSAFVLNKLGLQNLVLLGAGTATRISDLPSETVNYFKKLPGFDTLRLALADGAILVEGPSDELVVQKGYKDFHGKLPIEDGIEVISVGLAHKRFLELAIRLRRRVWIVTDNDGKTLDQVRSRFSAYLDEDVVSLHVGADPTLPTLEPQIAAANNLETLNAVLGRNFDTNSALVDHMLNDKTGCALKIFESPIQIQLPEYLRDVVGT